MIYIIVLVLGMVIGSFLNVCIYRIPKGESIAFPPSHCTVCNGRIKTYDLIPVLSYIWLKGRCRSCGERISIKYPLIELLTGILFLVVFIKFNLTVECLKYLIFVSILIVTAFIDLDHSIIPGKLMIFAGISGIIFNIIGYKSNTALLDYLYGFLAGGGVILLIVVLTGGMGGGDIQLMAVAGLFLGLKLTVLTLLFSFITGAIAGVTLMLLKKKSRRDYIPFGPWIALSATASIFIGSDVINWYISLF
jgi:leader peptidase (prepilin peptidase)/N-methyltransferase